MARVLPFWNEALAPAIRMGKRVVVAAHENSIRALVKYLDNMSDDDVADLNIPNGIPLVYELGDDLKPFAITMWALQMLLAKWPKRPKRKKKT